jgi:hypothetical protein
VALAADASKFYSPILLGAPLAADASKIVVYVLVALGPPVPAREEFPPPRTGKYRLFEDLSTNPCLFAGAGNPPISTNENPTARRARRRESIEQEFPMNSALLGPPSNAVMISLVW